MFTLITIYSSPTDCSSTVQYTPHIKGFSHMLLTSTPHIKCPPHILHLTCPEVSHIEIELQQPVN